MGKARLLLECVCGYMLLVAGMMSRDLEGWDRESEVSGEGWYRSWDLTWSKRGEAVPRLVAISLELEVAFRLGFRYTRDELDHAVSCRSVEGYLGPLTLSLAKTVIDTAAEEE